MNAHSADQLAAIRQALEVLCLPCHVYELRALDVPRRGDWTDTFLGYFNDLDAMCHAASELDGMGARGVYLTPNPVRPELLARADNRARKAKRGEGTTNEEVLRRCWFLIDFDPARPAGISASDAEKEAARERAEAVREYLDGLGFPAPVFADSGNGYHLNYRVDLPADDGGLLARCTRSASARFTDDAVIVDAGVHNAARIWKAYGTTARKGDPTPERPHRRAALLDVPPHLVPVPDHLLDALAELDVKPKPPPRSAPDLPTDAERVRSALAAIPPRPEYDTWMRIASAVLDGLDGDVTAAEAMLAAWSPEEEPGEYARKLRSPLERVRVGTLYHYARGYGWAAPRTASPRTASRPLGRTRGGADTDGAGAHEHAAEAEPEAGEAYIANGPRIPAAVYDALAEDLRTTCLLLREGHERDVFFTGLLPCLSAAMPNVLTRYSRRWKALPIMAAVVAPAGSGKGTLQLAADTVASIDERLRAASQARVDEWQALDKKERDGEQCPPVVSLRLPADNSLRAITDGLAAGGGRGLIFETEIRVLASSLKQDWGDFKGLLLKAAEQEPYERGRKGEPPTYLRRPELPAALSGTPRSFTDWMEDAEDGLFSRFLFYAFTAPPVWINQFEDENDAALDTALARIGRRLDGLHRALSERTLTNAVGEPAPLYLVLTRDQREHINITFATLQQAVHGTGRAELLASVKRGAFQAVRIAGVLALYRLAATTQGGCAFPSSLKSYTPSDAEVRAAVALVQCYLEHAARLAVSFASNPAAKLESEERRRFFEALPNDFETADALAVGEAMGMSTSAVERALKTFTDRHGLVARLRRGQYRKAPPADLAPLPSPLTEVTEAKDATEAKEEGLIEGQLPPLPSVPSEPSLPSDPAHGDGDGLPLAVPPELLDAVPGWEDEDDAPLDYL